MLPKPAALHQLALQWITEPAAREIDRATYYSAEEEAEPVPLPRLPLRVLKMGPAPSFKSVIPEGTAGLSWIRIQVPKQLEQIDARQPAFCRDGQFLRFEKRLQSSPGAAASHSLPRSSECARSRADRLANDSSDLPRPCLLSLRP